MHPTQPLGVGHRLIPTLIDHYAALSPPPVWAVIPKDENDVSKGFEDVTYKDLAHAVNRAAAWLKEHLVLPRRPEGGFETVAYTGPKDIRYPIIAVAAAKLRIKLLLPSPYASIAAQKHLVQASGCRVFMHGAPLPAPTRDGLVSANPTLQFLRMPESDELLWKEEVELEEVGEELTWDEAKDEPWLVFHTSGTTGTPKLITYTHRMMASLDAAELMPDASSETMNAHFRNRKWYTPLPSLHFVGMTVSLQFPIFLAAIVVIGPTTPSPTSPSLAASILHYSGAQGAVMPPALIDGLCDDAQGLQSLRNLDHLYFAGAPLSPRSAEKLVRYVPVRPAMGSTEAGAYFLRIGERELDWEWYSFRAGMGMEMRGVAGGGGLYEAVFVRGKEVERWQMIFRVYPEAEEWGTKDLFVRHPKHDDLWKYVGRTDDMIPFSHGENLYVADLEAALTAAHPAVSAVQIGGQGRPRPFLMIEWKVGTTLGQEDKEGVMTMLLEKANEKCSDLVKLTPELVLFTKPDRPLVRTVKGTVSRRESERLYEGDIEVLYHG